MIGDIFIEIHQWNERQKMYALWIVHCNSEMEYMLQDSCVRECCILCKELQLRKGFGE